MTTLAKYYICNAFYFNYNYVYVIIMCTELYLDNFLNDYSFDRVETSWFSRRYLQLISILCGGEISQE